MALSPRKRAEVQALIVRGLDIKTIADKTKVSRAQIYNMRAELEEDAKNNSVAELGKASPAIIKEVVKDIKARTPLALEGEVEKLIGAAESLQKLEVSFHKTFDNVLERANEMMKQEDLTIVDWQIITNTLAGAFKDIYNSKGTTINVANADNVAGQQANSLTMFQSRMKA